ncbi:hypothetical protein EYF80_063672 [Liparis tanakae]|uniref:Uncharacterized protein n=1 Tax=Liparis tanakae TaxID=230148 RepID=A0A4Z2EBR0_9TELE|nr:hypothetical protein EYF80_063672 [Liparis tanakae]
MKELRLLMQNAEEDEYLYILHTWEHFTTQLKAPKTCNRPILLPSSVGHNSSSINSLIKAPGRMKGRVESLLKLPSGPLAEAQIASPPLRPNMAEPYVHQHHLDGAPLPRSRVELNLRPIQRNGAAVDRWRERRGRKVTDVTYGRL